MTDADKLKLLDTMLADAWEFGPGEGGDLFWKGVLSCMGTVLEFGGGAE